jgi:hypothetical protein
MEYLHYFDGRALLGLIALWFAAFNWMRSRRYARAYDDLAANYQSLLTENASLSSKLYHRIRTDNQLFHSEQQG